MFPGDEQIELRQQGSEDTGSTESQATDSQQK